MFILNLMFSFYVVEKIHCHLEDEEDHLDPTDEREASEEPHGSSYS